MAKKQSEKVRQAAETKRLNNAIDRRFQEERIADAIERQNKALDDGLKTIDLETILKQKISDIDDKQKEQIAKKNELEKEIVEARKKYFGANQDIALLIEIENKEKIVSIIMNIEAPKFDLTATENTYQDIGTNFTTTYVLPNEKEKESENQG